MRLTLAVVVTFATAMLAMPGRAEDKEEGEAVEFKTVLTAFDGGPEKAAETVLSSKKELEEFVGSCTGAEERKVLTDLEVDFDKEVLVAVCLGPSTAVIPGASGKKTEISKVTKKGDVWTVRYMVVTTDLRREDPAFPVFVIRLPKQGQTFTFKRTDYSVGG